MKTIVKKTITLETKRHDFDNEFAYIEIWANGRLKDSYFVEKEFLFADGSVRQGGKKLFYSADQEEPEKTIKPINYENFHSFEKLYYITDEGEVQRLTYE